MKRNVMSLKAIINNIAKENNASAQSVLQTYMLERLLERISISNYKDNFILKGRYAYIRNAWNRQQNYNGYGYNNKRI